MTEIKICGLFRDCDIDYVNEARPGYAGFILQFPKSHRNISIPRAAELRRRLLPGIKAVGVFVNRPVDEILRAKETIGLDVIQLHGEESADEIREIQKKAGCPVWKAFRVQSEEDLEAAAESPADVILLDGGYGEGKSFDWSYVKEMKRPFFLAGGLTPENIPEAIERLQPALVDISSGVETEKTKDREKILRAVKAARSAGMEGRDGFPGAGQKQEELR